MQFTWHKTNGTSVEIDTNSDTSSAAANYLARNWREICGLNLILLSEALKWLGSFERLPRRTIKVRTHAIRAIHAAIAYLIEIRYIDLYEVAYSDDTAETTKRKNISNAAQAFACAYQTGILTGRWFLHPCRVLNAPPLPAVVIPNPADVVKALISVQAPHGGTAEQRAQDLMVRVQAIMDRLHPVGGDWILQENLTHWYNRLLTAWAPYLDPSPPPRVITVSTPSGSRSQTPLTPPAHTPVQTPPHVLVPTPPPIAFTAPGHIPATTPNLEPAQAEDVMDIEVPKAPSPRVDPAEVAAQQEYIVLMNAIKQAIPSKMAHWDLDIARAIAILGSGGTIHPRQHAAPENISLAAEVRQLIVNRRKISHSDALQWAALLGADGFDLRDLPETVTDLLAKGRTTGPDGEAARNQFGGYAFQIRCMLDAWQEARLRATERKVPGLPYDRYVDSVEWTRDGVYCYREYKSYDPTGEPTKKTVAAFKSQLYDYGLGLGQDLAERPMEYVFENGVPQWALTELRAKKTMFPHGLFVIDFQTSQRDKL